MMASRVRAGSGQPAQPLPMVREHRAPGWPVSGADGDSAQVDERFAGLRRGDLLEACGAPPVVCLAGARSLLDALASSGAGAFAVPEQDLDDEQPWLPSLPAEYDSAVGEVVQQYLLDAPENRRAFHVVMESLAGKTGQGLLVNGLHGAGKSHFLAVVALLAGCPGSWRLFLRAHSEYGALARMLLSRSSLLAVAIPLEERRGSVDALEDIVFEEAEQALNAVPGAAPAAISKVAFALQTARERLAPLWGEALDRRSKERSGLSWESLCCRDAAEAVGLASEVAEEAGIPLGWNEPRRERLHRLLDAARQRGRRGVVLLIDELSLFLGSRAHRPFCEDASFLQFMGQMARHHPVWLVAGLQRGLEETGGIDADTLRKLKDRYAWDLTLSLAQIRRVLEQRVARRRSPEWFDDFVEWLWVRRDAQGLTGGLEPAALRAAYPLHPLTMECLAEASNRLFSRNRSLVDFARRAVERGGDRPAEELVGPDAVYRYFLPAAAERPDLKRLVETCEEARRLAPDLLPESPAHARRLVEALGALALAGLRRPVSVLASALPPTEPAQGPEGVQSALERLRARSGCVEVMRGESPGQDIYFLDSGCEVGRLIRQRLGALEAGLIDGDPRILEAALDAASDASLPLAGLGRASRVDASWMGSPRPVLVSRQELSAWNEQDTAREMACLADSRQPECLRLVVGNLLDPGAPRESFMAAAAAAPDERWRAALVAWIPRALRPAELRALREHAACRLLLGDPSMQGSSLGRQALSRLGTEARPLAQRIRQIVRQAYAEGAIVGADGPVAGPADLAKATRLDAVTSLIGARVFPLLFPAASILMGRPGRAPAGGLKVLLERLVAPGRAAAGNDEVLDEAVREIAFPLGVAVASDGGYVLSDPHEPVAGFVEGLVSGAQGSAWAEVTGSLMKSAWGLSQDAAELLLTVMARRSRLVACDAAGAPVPVTAATIPIGLRARSLRRPESLPIDLYPQLESLRLAVEAPCAEPGPDADSLLWRRLCDLRSEAEGEQLSESLDSLVRILGSPPEAWESSHRLLDSWCAALRLAQPELDPLAGLRRLLGPGGLGDIGQFGALYRARRALQSFVRDTGPALARSLAVLASPDCVFPEGSEMGARRQRLLEAARSGDDLVRAAGPVAQEAEAILQWYRDAYLQWHARVFSEAQFAPFRRLGQLPGWHALEQLERLPLPTPVHGPDILTMALAQANRQCFSGGLASALLRGPVCPGCHLPLGTPVETPPVEILRARVRQAIDGRIDALRQPELRGRLTGHCERLRNANRSVAAALGRALGLLLAPERETFAGAGDNSSLMARLDEVLDEAVGRELRAALLAGQPVARRLPELSRALSGREMTRLDAVRAFTRWLDPEDRLRPGDLVRFDE